MKAITEETRAEVWLAAIKHLVDQEDNQELNLVLEVQKPHLFTPFSNLIESEVDKCLRGAELSPLNTVAETIFPATEYKKSGLKGVFQTYPDEIHPLIKSADGNKRGTYAYRLVRGYDQDNSRCNPLEMRINRMKKELSRNNAKKSIYEISLEESYSIPINRNDTSYIGFPCLSHISFKLCAKNKLIHLTAIYRSQHYIKKALGNLLGLARLQGFMARELGIKPGVLVCHATDARLESTSGIGKTKIRELIKHLEEKKIENQ